MSIQYLESAKYEPAHCEQIGSSPKGASFP